MRKHLEKGANLGSYGLSIVSNFSGRAKANVTVDDAVGEINFSISNFPNPARNNTTLQYSLNVDSEVIIQLIDCARKGSSKSIKCR